jgi:hypothetical protein
MYGKPILAARDAKCSAKEAEAGALAMEALHKQVCLRIEAWKENRCSFVLLLGTYLSSVFPLCLYFR